MNSRSMLMGIRRGRKRTGEERNNWSIGSSAITENGEGLWKTWWCLWCCQNLGDVLWKTLRWGTRNTWGQCDPTCGRKTQRNLRQSSREGRYRHDMRGSCPPSHKTHDQHHAGPALGIRWGIMWRKACPSAFGLFHLAPREIVQMFWTK